MSVNLFCRSGTGGQANSYHPGAETQRNGQHGPLQVQVLPRQTYEDRRRHRYQQVGWERLPIATTLEKEFDLPVSMENDCNLAALAEAHFGAGQGHRTVFYVTLGTGVGGGIVHDGHIQAFGDIGEAEIGHIVVVPEGPPCWCGGRGCVESVCSGPGISQLAAWLTEQNPDLWAQSELKEVPQRRPRRPLAVQSHPATQPVFNNFITPDTLRTCRCGLHWA